MKQYLDLVKRVQDEGVWVYNKRTGKRCKTIINADMEFDVGAGRFPLLTTRKAAWKSAIAELLGYLRGYDSAAQFRAIGCNTWNANANDNEAWLANPHRKGEDDMGRVYGVQGRSWRKSDGTTLDQLYKVYNNLRKGIDDRGEILTFWNPGEFDEGCLRPCMHTHQFSLLDGKIYLNSIQRSNDLLLGEVFNMPQCYVLLALMAQITGHIPAMAYQKLVNVHIYEDQLEVLEKEGQLLREPRGLPFLYINPEIKTLEDVLTWVTTDDFRLLGYAPYPPIKYPFSV